MLDVVKRWLGRILAGVSLVAALAIGGVWVRSYWVGDNISWTNAQDDGHSKWAAQSLGAATGRGSVMVYYVDAGPIDNAERYHYIHRTNIDRHAGWL